MKTIEITVSIKGETTRSLELALGARESESLKGEFYQQARSELEQNAKQ